MWSVLMPSMKLDAVTVTSADISATAKFYEFLGFEFPEFSVDAKHLEPITPPGDVRLMIDHRDLMKSITGKEPAPPNHSSFAIKCESPADVDVSVSRIRDAGHCIVKEPWDAFWGQRYAIVADPDGYMIDLFAPSA
jgi:catechol 2,3-dioxygenase-like lactoylglutathione lyase family enzyme